MALDKEFLDLYKELAEEVEQAHYEFLPERLLKWFNLLDTTPEVADVIRRLEAEGEIGYKPWLVNVQVGRQLPRPWHAEPDRALGIQFVLFRFFSTAAPEEVSRFGFTNFRTGRDVNDNAHVVIEQVFMPMTRDLRRYLERELRNAHAQDREIPASDRVVRLDDNDRRQLREAVATLEHILQGTNDFEDAEEKEQRIAEVSAVGRLLEAVRVRLQPIISLLTPLAQEAMTKLKDMFVGKAVVGFLALLGAILKVVWPWIIPPAN
jgi:hypothetical protein